MQSNAPFLLNGDYKLSQYIRTRSFRVNHGINASQVVHHASFANGLDGFSHSVGATITPDINYDVIDSALVDSINSEDNLEHPVIVQFSVEMNAQIRAFLITIDVRFEDESQLLNGGLANMDAKQIAHLSNHPNIRFLELDRPLQTFYLDEPIKTPEPIMMHETVHVTNATTAWSRAIIQRDGSVKLTDTGAFAEWDGDGTTAVDLDTGVDAEHPDFDYAGAWNGEKVIYSAKLM